MKANRYVGLLGLLAVAVVCVAVFPSFRKTPSISNRIVVTAIGLEKAGEVYHLSIQAVDALKTAGSLSEQSEKATAVYRAQGESVAQALQSFLNETGRSTYILHNRIIALGLSQCRDTPLEEQLDYFIRNLEGRSSVLPVVCRCDPAELLSIDSGNDAIPAEYVAQLLEEGARCGLAVSARMLDVQRTMSGMYDAVLPIVDVENGVPRLDGTALFREGVLVGELSAEQTTALLLAKDRVEECLIVRDGVTFRLQETDTRLKIDRNEDVFSYVFSVSGTMDIVEVDSPVSKEERQRLTEELSRYITQTVRETMIVVVRVYGCDPLGLSRQTAKQYRTVTQQQALQRLNDGNIEVQTTIHLTESGFLT